MSTAQEVIKALNLQPATPEGGYNALTYVADLKIPGKDLPGFGGERTVSGAIYYLLEPTTFSAMHKVVGDMVYHFYLGDPVEMLLLHPNKMSETVRFGNDVTAGLRPQITIRGGTWLGSRMVQGGSFALMGVTMAPGFDPADYTLGDRKELIKRYADQADLITALTREPQ